MKPPLPAGAVFIAIASAAMIAQQVAGKATRDALYLSNFDVTTLPAMMAISAVLTIFAVLWLSRMILRNSPEAVVPVSFAASGLVLLTAWPLSYSAPKLAAVAVYLHSALFGPAVIAAFWSYVNERFDPRAGKRAIGWIAGAGTLGGVLGGVLAWRAASLIAVPTMLPLLAAMHVVCAWGSLRSRDAQSAPAGSTARDAEGLDSSARTVSIAEFLPLRILREAPYLQNLAFVVALGAVTCGILDYLFSVEAVKIFSEGPELLSFFAFFWLLVGLVSFLLQTLLGGLVLSKLGLAFTIGLLPAAVVVGGVFAFAVPGLWSTGVLRGGEAVLRNSLFRAGYELLYTPLSEQQKRSTKLLIDVGFDRIGTVVASAIIFATLQLTQDGERASVILLALTIAAAVATLARSRPLHVGYVPVLEESLRAEADKLEPSDAVELPETQDSVARDEIVEHLKDLPDDPAAALASVEPTQAGLPAEAASPARCEGLSVPIEAIRDLCSGDPKRVRGILGAEAPLTAPLIPLAILLLASAEFQRDAIRALRKVARSATGQLADALCDPSVPADIRRRIPRVLSACPEQAAANALIRGTEDERFEVRYECGRALLQITEAEPKIAISLETAIAIVKRELASSKELWDSQRAPEFDEDENEPPALIDRLLRDRFDRSFEHVFSVLALVLDRDSIRLAFKALHQDDARLRGTALEYLETVLPDEIRDAVWPYLGEARPRRPARPASEILADLSKAREAAASPESAEPAQARGRAGGR
jgi:ATP/ADP translocase